MPQPVIVAGARTPIRKLNGALSTLSAAGLTTIVCAAQQVAAGGRRGDVTVEADEGVRPGTTAEKLGELPAAFSKGGTA